MAFLHIFLNLSSNNLVYGIYSLILFNVFRLKCPKRCSNEIYLELMHSCWKFSPSERRTFSELTVVSSELLRRSKNELGDFLG